MTEQNNIDRINPNELEVTVEMSNNIATVSTSEEQVFKVLFADREKIKRFRDIKFNEDELDYEPLIIYEESTLRKEIIKKVREAITTAFSSSNSDEINKLDVAE